MGRVIKILKNCLIAVLILLALLFTWVFIQSKTRPNEVPSIFGYKPFIVLSGSMETELYSGDLAIVKKVDVNTLKKNEHLTFFSSVRFANVVLPTYDLQQPCRSARTRRPPRRSSSYLFHMLRSVPRWTFRSSQP